MIFTCDLNIIQESVHHSNNWKMLLYRINQIHYITPGE